MFLHEPTFDLDELAAYNTHVHTNFSRCASEEMKAVDIVKEAERCGIKVLALTDHNYPQKKNAVAAQRLVLLDQLREIDTSVKVLIGAELSAYGPGKFADNRWCDDSLDWRLYTTNHFHQSYWMHPEDKSPRGYCKFMLDIMDTVIDSGRADCFAHPFMAQYIKCFDDFRIVTRSFTDNEIGDIMEKGNRASISWDLNMPAIFKDPEFHHRYFQIGKEIGVVFNIGTDAHKLANIDTHQFIPRFKEILY